jgi:hypothetical protein
MPDIFISYSSADSKDARKIYDWLSKKGVNVFLAEVCLEGGDAWDEKIKKNLREANNFIFLASRKACASQSVNQEIGMAIRDNNKNVIPVVWDMPPTELPGFLKCNTQAVDMRGKDPQVLLAALNRTVTKVKKDKAIAWIIVLLLLGALLWVFCRKKK